MVTMSNVVITFVKYPEAGMVKTRLGEKLGYDAAAKLYSAFVRDMLHNFAAKGIAPLIAYDPFRTEAEYRKWLGEHNYLPQQGSDLGERMYNALRSAFVRGFDSCVLTGSDLPDLDPEYLLQAAHYLKETPACIGTASDGGYYLIGFQKKSLTDSIFKNMEWSTKKVFASTISRLKRKGITPKLLPEHQDIDTIADLTLLHENPAIPKLCPETAAVLKKVFPESSV